MKKMIVALAAVMLLSVGAGAFELERHPSTRDVDFHLSRVRRGGFITIRNSDWVPYVLDINEEGQTVYIHYAGESGIAGYTLNPGESATIPAGHGAWVFQGNNGRQFVVGIRDSDMRTVTLFPDGDPNQSVIGMSVIEDQTGVELMMAWDHRSAEGWPANLREHTYGHQPPPPPPYQYGPPERRHHHRNGWDNPPPPPAQPFHYEPPIQERGHMNPLIRR